MVFYPPPTLRHAESAQCLALGTLSGAGAGPSTPRAEGADDLGGGLSGRESPTAPFPGDLRRLCQSLGGSGCAWFPVHFFHMLPCASVHTSSVRLPPEQVLSTMTTFPSAVILDAEGAVGVSLNLAFMRGLSLMGVVPRD